MANNNGVCAYEFSNDGSFPYTVKKATTPQTAGGAAPAVLGTNLAGCHELYDLNSIVLLQGGPYILGKTDENKTAVWGADGTCSKLVDRYERKIAVPPTDQQHSVVGRRVSNSLVVPGGAHLWRNGQIRDVAALCRNPANWQDFNITQVSPENNLLIGTATKDDNNDGKFDVGTAEKPGPDKKHGVLLLPVEITSVSFDGDKYWQLESDDATTQYSAPQWTDASGNYDASDTGRHNYAVAYTRNTKPKIGATFKFPGAFNWTNLKFKASGPDGVSIPATAGTIETDGVSVTMPVAESTMPLPNTVKYYNKTDTTAFTLNWSMSLDGGTTWATINSTKHTVYVTLGDPNSPGTENQETPFYLGCKDANGVSAQTDLVTGVWNDVKGRTLYRVGTKTAMTYYANSASPYTTCNGLDQLLATGDGRCGSYQLLMLQILYDQGVPTTTALPKIVTPSTDYVSQAITAYKAKYGIDPTSIYTIAIRNVFFVKNWTLKTTTPFIPVDLPGIPAQGNTDPIAVFGDHALVEMSGQIYDPSYGDGPYSSVVAWQDASVAGFGVQFIDSSDLAANFVLYVGKLEVTGHKDISYADP